MATLREAHILCNAITDHITVYAKGHDATARRVVHMLADRIESDLPGKFRRTGSSYSRTGFTNMTLTVNGCMEMAIERVQKVTDALGGAVTIVRF